MKKHTSKHISDSALPVDALATTPAATRRPRRSPRDAATIEAEIMRATKSLIEERGFSGLTVTGVIRRARIEPKVFYKRYQNLDILLDEFTRLNDYWPETFSKLDFENADLLEIFTGLLVGNAEALYSNRAMQRMLIWGCETNHPSARSAARLREAVSQPFLKKFFKRYEGTDMEAHAPTIAAMIVSGVYYLVLQQNVATFCDVDFSTEDGKRHLAAATGYMVKKLFGEVSTPPADKKKKS